MANIDIISFTDYTDDEELLDWYCYNYETDDLDEMVCWLNKQGYKREDIEKVFSKVENVELFLYIWEQQHL